MCYHEAQHPSLPGRAFPFCGEKRRQLLTRALRRQRQLGNSSTGEIPFPKKKPRRGQGNDPPMPGGQRGPRYRGPPNWAGLFPSKAVIPWLVWITAEPAARAGSPACLHPSRLPKWEGRGAGDDEEGSHESPEPASRVS